MQTSNYGFLFLAPMETSTAILIAVLVATVFAVGGLLLGMFLKKVSFEKKQGEISKVTEKMLEDAREESRTIKKEAILEAKEQELKLRNELEKESKEKKSELQRIENRLNQKEESLDKKEELLQKRNEETTRQQNSLRDKHAEFDKKLSDIKEQHDKMIAEFEKISQMSKEEAKQQLVDAITDEAKRDAAGLVKNI